MVKMDQKMDSRISGMKRKRKVRMAGSFAACLLLAVCLLAGCGGKSSPASGGSSSAAESEPASSAEADSVEETVSPAAAADQIIYDEAIAGWHIQIENVRVDTSMQNVSVDLGYSGVETSEYVKEAEEGMTFCLVKLKIEKDGSQEQIEWDRMVLADDKDREYHRIEDSFIADLGMKHMPGSNLNFGSYEGWIAFEIDEDAKGLALSYSFKEETMLADLGY